MLNFFDDLNQEQVGPMTTNYYEQKKIHFKRTYCRIRGWVALQLK